MGDEPRGRCPFIETPCTECYVSQLNSVTIERAILYCGGAYETCEIYGRLVPERRRRPADAPEDAAGSAEEPSDRRSTATKRHSG